MPEPNKATLIFYIGAGASAGSLPLVSNIPQRMRDLANELSHDEYDRDLPDRYRTVLPRLCQETSRLAESAISCPIDVLARRLYLQDKIDDLRTLKATLSAYFVLEQARNPCDRRYCDFFAYMADRDAHGKLAMPTDVRVISWNYDMQFEKSFAEFIEDPYYEKRRSAGVMLQVVPTGIEAHEHYEGIFSVLKLNGTAGTRDTGTRRSLRISGGSVGSGRDRAPRLVKTYDPVVYGQPGKLAPDDLPLILHFYQSVESGTDEPYLQFAWEDDTRRADVIALVESFAPVKTVVVIGYSFPLVNRDLDREVFEILGPEEVFLQVAGDNGVKDRLVGLGVNSKTIDVVGDHNQFHIPHSYSPSTRLSRDSRAEQDRGR